MVSAIGALIAFGALCLLAIAALAIAVVAIFLTEAKKSLSQFLARTLHR